MDELGKRAGFHGNCAEIRAIKDALSKGYNLSDLEGATIKTVKMFEGKATDEIVEACDCCKEILSKLGISDAFSTITKLG
ncbi:hypothetical protein [Hafnia alvei]|nr:hypothetical protein [Hafnia alvei]